MNNNMRIWSAVEKTDPEMTKSYTGMGGFKGTAIKPTYLMRKATEMFGPCGEGWGWTVVDERYDEGAPLQAPTKEWPEAPLILAKLHTLRIELWYVGTDGKKCTVTHYGHTPFVLLQGGKIVTDWEAAKKSLTDAISKCLQPLGFAADIHMGMWDDRDYVAERKEESALEHAENKEAEAARQQQERLDWLKAALDTMANAQTLHEVTKLHAAYVRSASRRQEEKFVKRLAMAFEERKAQLEQKEAA
jgi:hypothetical protein